MDVLVQYHVVFAVFRDVSQVITNAWHNGKRWQLLASDYLLKFSP